MSENLIPFPSAGVTSRESAEASGPSCCPPEQLVAAVEACLFAVGSPVSTMRLSLALGVDQDEIEDAIDAVRSRLATRGSGMRVVEVAEGWQLRTDPLLATWVAAVRGGRPYRLSKPALETLAVVAFRQPVSKGAVDDVRGVDSGGVMKMLTERGLLKSAGHSDEPGRPLLYATTPQFLELFGMRTLADLPTLRDLLQLRGDDHEDGPVPVVAFPSMAHENSSVGPGQLE